MFKKWLMLAADMQFNVDRVDELECPSCGHKAIDYLYVGNPSTMVGFEQVWCNHCNRGIHISRVIIPPNVKMMSFKERIAKKNFVPNFVQVTPD